MRLILIGCEYVGKTTLADALQEWGKARGLNFHMDDHFSIPDEDHLNEEEQRAMWELLPAIKERYQRFQIAYHVGVLERWEHCIVGGFHIEEVIYGPRYYYERFPYPYHRELEPKLPSDTILVLLTAGPEVIRARMAKAPHRYQLVQPNEVEEIQEEFQAEFGVSQIRQKVRLDTSEFRPDEIMDRFLTVVRPRLNVKDLLLLSQ